jgi:type I restriction enzyme S subunit
MAGEWVERTVDEVADVVGGSTPSTRDPSNFDGDVPWLTPKDLSGPHTRYVERGERNLSRRGLKSCSAQLLPKNSVLLSSRAPIGYLAIAANPIATNQGFRSLVVKPDYDHEFVYYWLSANIEELERHASGSTFKELAGTALKQIRLRLPADRTEQRAIAHILGTLDDKIELNRRMSETLEAMARALFKSWFVDFTPVRAKAEGRDPGLPKPLADLFPDSFEDSELGEIPRGWEVKTLSDICEKPQYGYTASASDEPVGPRFLRITDINKRDWIEWGRVPFCSIEPAQREKYALAPGDIVIARIADPGHGALIEETVDAVFASYLIRFRPQRHGLARYLQYWLRSDSYWSAVRSAQSGTTRANLNAKVLGGFGLVVPPADAHRLFDQFIGAFRGRVVANVQDSLRLAALRDTLHPKLISGELRVKDADRFLQGAVA